MRMIARAILVLGVVAVNVALPSARRQSCWDCYGCIVGGKQVQCCAGSNHGGMTCADYEGACAISPYPYTC